AVEPDLFDRFGVWASFFDQCISTVSAAGLAVSDFGRTSPVTTPVPLGGRVVARRYFIDAMLGQGGQAAVYRAFDPALQRTVAVKLLKPAGEEEVTNERFLHEADLQRDLAHPAILPVLEWGYEGPRGFLVFPLCSDNMAHAQKKQKLRARAA